MVEFEAFLKENMRDPAFRVAYDALAEEYDLARTLIADRARANLARRETAAYLLEIAEWFRTLAVQLIKEAEKLLNDPTEEQREDGKD